MARTLAPGLATEENVARDRFELPLYTLSEAAYFLRVPQSTFQTWAQGYERRREDRPATRLGAIVTMLEGGLREARIPFVGLVEGMVAAAFRRAGVSMQHIRRALPTLAREIGIEHALASKRLYTDGAQILFDFAARPDFPDLAVVVTGQGVFSDVVQDYLTRIEYARDGYAERMFLPIGPRGIVQADPKRAFGRPVFAHGAAPMQDVLDRFQAGEPIADVAADFGVPSQDVEEVIRALLPRAA